MARDPLCGGAGRSVLMGEGKEKDMKWEEADSLLSKKPLGSEHITHVPFPWLLAAPSAYSSTLQHEGSHLTPLPSSPSPQSSLPSPFIFSLLCLDFFSPSRSALPHSSPSRAFFIPALLAILPHPRSLPCYLPPYLPHLHPSAFSD